jgi:predicted transcriptional regulator
MLPNERISMTKSQGSESVTLRVPSDVVASIEAIAEATARSRSYIIVRALKTYLINEGADVLAAVRGRDQIGAGEYEDIDDLIADVDKIVAGQAA